MTLKAIQLNGQRCYYTEHGFSSSVTNVLSETKPEHEKQALANWRASVGEAKAMSGASRGTQLHILCERYFKQEKLGAISEEVAPYWDNIRPLLDRIKPQLIEQFVWHPQRFSGTFDLYGGFDESECLIIDYKTSNKPKKIEWITDYLLQTIAYAEAIEHTLGLKVDGTIILMTTPEMNQVFHLNREDMERYRPQWHERLKLFHERVDMDDLAIGSDTEGEAIAEIYQQLLAQPEKSGLEQEYLAELNRLLNT